MTTMEELRHLVEADLAFLEGRKARVWAYRVSHGCLTIKVRQIDATLTDEITLYLVFCNRIHLDETWTIQQATLEVDDQKLIYRDLSTEIVCTEICIEDSPTPT